MAMTAWAAKFETSSICLSERTHLLAIDGDRAHQLALLEHWDHDDAPGAGQIVKGEDARITRGVNRLGHRVGNVDDALGLRDARKPGSRRRPNHGLLPPYFGIGGRGAMQRHGAVSVAFPEVERAELGFAQPRRVGEHGVKDRLQRAG
jgi:hypothetical protein